MYIDHCVKKYPCSELFWSAFSRIRTEYGEILCISPYSVRMSENTDQNNSEYKHFSRSGHTQRCVSSKNTRKTFTKRRRKFPISIVGVCKVAQNSSSDWNSKGRKSKRSMPMYKPSYWELILHTWPVHFSHHSTSIVKSQLPYVMWIWNLGQWQPLIKGCNNSFNHFGHVRDV